MDVVRKISQTTLSSYMISAHSGFSLPSCQSVTQLSATELWSSLVKSTMRVLKTRPSKPSPGTMCRTRLLHHCRHAHLVHGLLLQVSFASTYAAYNIDNPAMLRAKLKPATPKFLSHDISKNPFHQTTIGWTTLQFAGSNTRTGTWWHHSFDEWNEGVGGCHHFVLE